MYTSITFEGGTKPVGREHRCYTCGHIWVEYDRKDRESEGWDGGLLSQLLTKDPEDEIMDAILTLPGIADVDVFGGHQPEIRAGRSF